MSSRAGNAASGGGVARAGCAGAGAGTVADVLPPQAPVQIAAAASEPCLRKSRRSVIYTASLRLVNVKSRTLSGGTTTATPGLPLSDALTRVGRPIS